MASIYKRNFKKQGKATRSRIWFFDYTDESGKRITGNPGYSDKQLTLQVATKIERRIDSIKAGMPVANEDMLLAPINEPINLYVDSLRSAGKAPIYVYNVNRVLVKTNAACNFKRIRDINSARLRKYVDSFMTGSVTRNVAQDTMKRFIRFCIKSQWLTESPLGYMTRHEEPNKVKRRPRRAYTKQEVQQMLDASAASRQDSKRTIIYQIAAQSGLRRSEIARLQVRDIDLSNPASPLWRLRPEATKGRRIEVIPMFASVAALIKPLVENRKPAELLFKKMPSTETVVDDLRKAGIKRIDDNGKRLDFHSFRYFFCSTIAGVLPIQKVRLLMRHKDIRQTMNTYADLDLNDIADDVWNLPNLF